jgi:hypothetical protein
MPPPVKHKHSRSERAHLRNVKRRQGPSAQRRRERREQLQPKPDPQPTETPTPIES